MIIGKISFLKRESFETKKSFRLRYIIKFVEFRNCQEKVVAKDVVFFHKKSGTQ